MDEVSKSDLPTIAAYTDESGRYTIRADDKYLITTINYGPGGYEEFVQTLTPEDFGDEMDWDMWKHSDRFGSCPDVGEDGGVWIDGQTYSIAYADVYLVD